MNKRLAVMTSVLALSALGSARGPVTSRAAEPLIVHEWGTFTSVAGRDGKAINWLPLNGPADLPCFVDRLEINIKGSLAGRVRMETPVLYFYASGETDVDVKVRFRQGLVTEWFPDANVTPRSAAGFTRRRPDFSSSITWPNVRVAPAAAPDFPTDDSSSHYYVARQTDASPLRVGSQQEKFLFYRGVGDFQPPIVATRASDGRTVVSSPDGQPLGDVILFDNAGGMMAHQVRYGSGGVQITFDPPAGDGEIPPPLVELEQILIAQGLYSREAHAMVETWRDSWFEEGTRLFYVVSGPAIDAILPLEINPAPTEVARVFVGRVELITPRTPRRFVPTSR